MPNINEARFLLSQVDELLRQAERLTDRDSEAHAFIGDALTAVSAADSAFYEQKW